MVVTGKNLFHNALYLVLSFFGVAVLYILLEAEFIAGIQILIYVGAIVDPDHLRHHAVASPDGAAPDSAQLTMVGVGHGRRYSLPGAWASPCSRWTGRPRRASSPADTIGLLGQAFMGAYVLPFEVASVILLVALVGSIIIARER